MRQTRALKSKVLLPEALLVRMEQEVQTIIPSPSSIAVPGEKAFTSKIMSQADIMKVPVPVPVPETPLGLRRVAMCSLLLMVLSLVAMSGPEKPGIRTVIQSRLQMERLAMSTALRHM